MIIAPIRANILLDPAFGWCPTTTSVLDCEFATTELNEHVEEIAVYQWGSAGFLNNTDLYICDVPEVTDGISNVKFSNASFYSPPEFGIYLA